MSETAAEMDQPAEFVDTPDAGARGVSEAKPSATARRQRRAVMGIVIGFLVLVSVCLLAGVLAWQSNESIRAVRATLLVRRAAFAASGELLRAESAQRAFLLTHDQSYLPGYRDAIDGFAAAMDELGQVTQARQDWSNEVTDYRRVTAAKLQELQLAIGLAEAGQDAQALALVQSGVGARSMERSRAVLSQLVASLDQIIDASAPWQALLSKILLFTIGLAAVCVTALSFVVFRDTRRSLQFLEGRERALRKLAATLEHRVERRTRSLSEANQRFDAALRASRVTVFTQDRDLRYTWTSADTPDATAEHRSAALLPIDTVGTVIGFKQHVIETGEPDTAEIRVADEGGEKWYGLSIHPLRDRAGRVNGLIGGAVEITERKRQEARIRLLMREVTHRSKNLLSVIVAIMRQTAANSTSTEDFQRRFSERLHSLAGSHDLLVLEDWGGASLRDLIRSQLGHYSDLVGSQIELSGPAMQIQPDAAQHIGMALHELATNAAKYGALSTPEGRVRIAWTTPATEDQEGVCRLVWEESDGPPVTPPSRRGFGRVVIERTVARAVGGEVKVSYPETGVCWELAFPRSVLV